MVRFLSPEWVDAANTALAVVSGPDATPATDPAGGRHSSTVRQVVSGGPSGDVQLLLVIRDGAVTLSLDDTTPADVTIALGWNDAAALSRGEFPVAAAITEGRVRVRGDLSVLAVGQGVLAAAQPRLGSLAEDTTY